MKGEKSLNTSIRRVCSSIQFKSQLIC